MANPRVSILMLTFNRADWLDRAIASIVEQTLQAWELIVVHDGPNRRIPEILAAWTARDARIRYFHREIPGNIADATNFGLQQASGEYIAILDDDDRWATPHKLQRQVDFLDSHPDYVACGGGVIVVDGQGRETMRYLKPEVDEEIKRVALVANPIAHSTAMYRRSVIQKCGGYDSSLAGFQDWNVWLELGRAGKLYNLPEYLLEYTIWEGGGSFQQQKKNTESAVRIVWRHRRNYPGALVGMTIAVLYHAYAHLPEGVKRATFATLSRLKKALFASKQPAGQGRARV